MDTDLRYQNLLPFNLDDLLHLRTVEAERIEFKATWDEQIEDSFIRTVAAFANDLNNQNGGYIILGVETDPNGHPVLPPRGLDDLNVDELQGKISGRCKANISPEFLPLIFVQVFQGKTLLIIRVPAGDNCPYQAPSRQGRGRAYFIRSGSATMEATGDLLRRLLEQTAKIPFDDRRSLNGTEGDISPRLVKIFLNDVRSSLAEMDFDIREIYLKLHLLVKINEHYGPRNVALLFFNDQPDKFFPQTFIEVVQFGDDAGGDLIEEKKFGGPLPEQIRSCLSYLDGLGGTLLKKIPGQPEVERTVAYPYEAMEEAIVNAVYHRSYEEPTDPVKVYLYPDRMEITSIPGPVPGIEPHHIQSGRVPPVRARNRRIGDFLKDLRLAEGRGTGIPKIKRKMQENGSPEAEFDFDAARTYFRVTLPVHPRYLVLHALREAAHLWAVGEKKKACHHLERAFQQQPSSGTVASQLIEYWIGLDEFEQARQVLEAFDRQGNKQEAAQPYLTFARLLLDRDRNYEASGILNRVPSGRTINETIDAAILRKRAKDFQGSHRLFAEAYALNPDDPKLIHEFAQTKINLAKGQGSKSPVKRRLNQEASELLRRAIQLSDDPVRSSWCWFDLAGTLDWLEAAKSEVEAAFLKALSLMPAEHRFQDAFKKWKQKSLKTKDR